MPKKPTEKLRVPLNCLIAPATKSAITDLQKETQESQGEIVDRAVALLAYGEEIKVAGVENIERVSDALSTVPRGFVRGIREKGSKR